MNALPVLIRREFWEHRATLVMVPLAICVLYLILCALGGAGLHVNLMDLGRTPSTSVGFLTATQGLLTILLYLLMAVVVFFYLCDCLYAERKDRSILFWKSLPVSDTATVLSKLIVALIAMPLVVYVLSLVTNLIAFGMFKILLRSGTPAGDTSDWTFLNWLLFNGYLIVDIFVLALWFAPVAAYQLFISALVPRAPFVFTVLPPLVLALGERLFFGTQHVRAFIGYRLGAVPLGSGSAHSASDVTGAINALRLFTDEAAGLWIGVAAAAALLVLTIRVRRHRADG